jgi:hypothetical protein
LKNNCKYRFAWEIPESTGKLLKAYFEGGHFFSENKFIVPYGGSVLTEIREVDLALLRPLSNIGSQIDGIIASTPEGVRTLFYLQWLRAVYLGFKQKVVLP